MNPIPITLLRGLNELFMIDRCHIWRDPEGTGDDPWDEDSGTYTRPAPDSLDIYDGICMVYPAGGAATIVPEGGIETSKESYWVEVPVNNGFYKQGDYVQINDIDETGDQAMLGVIMRVDLQVLDSFGTSSRLRCELMKRVPFAS